MSPAAAGLRRRLLVINPNTSAGISATLAGQMRLFAPQDVSLQVLTARFGSPYIADEASYAVAAVAALDAWAQAAEVDAGVSPAVVIACFGDPGLMALRECASGPVTGLAEASVAQAARHGRCAIVTGGRAWKPMLERLLPALPQAGCVAGIQTVELTGAQMHADPQGAETVLLQACREAAERWAVDSVILGGAGLAGMAARLQDRLAVPLIDSVQAAVAHVWQAPASQAQGAPAWLGGMAMVQA